MSSQLIHASCVSRFGRGILLRGASGSGKSSLALQLIHRGWMLVADDQVELTATADALMATAPQQLRGWLEIYALGLCPMPTLLSSRIDFIVDLVEGPVERLPMPSPENLLGHKVDRLILTKNHEKNARLVVEALRKPPLLG
jgi:HPr kinase/phosphorylase